MVELGDVTPLFDFDLTIHSAFELGIGMAANLQYAAALDPVRRAIDFGLENMVHEIIRPHIPVHGGRVAVPDGPGLGVEPDWDEIMSCKLGYHDDHRLAGEHHGRHDLSAVHR